MESQTPASTPCPGPAIETGFKITILGSSNTGKSALAQVFLVGSFPKKYLPTVREVYRTHPRHPIPVYGTSDTYRAAKIVELGGDPTLDHLSLQLFDTTDVFVLVYACNDRTSFADIQKWWFPLTQELNPATPVLIVGCKSDARPHTFGLRAGMPGEGVGEQEGRLLGVDLGAAGFVECSAKRCRGVDKVFETSAKLVEDLRELKRNQELEEFVKRANELAKQQQRESKSGCVIT